ncbi:MAG: ferrous iron transport protein B [Chloroflexota bacterium]
MPFMPGQKRGRGRVSTGCHSSIQERGASGRRRILLVGNPNVGKSVIFHHLTGKYVTVSNYPGTTVDIASARASFDGNALVVDSPGVNSLVPRSEDERVARDLLLEQVETTVLQVADAKNLQRGLVLTSQLAEAGLPMVLALNMADEAERSGISINAESLSRRLGIPVVSTIAVKGRGIERLKNTLGAAKASLLYVRYDEDIEGAISRVEALLPGLPVSKRSIAIMLLCGDRELQEWLSPRMEPGALEAISRLATELRSRYARPLAYVINQRRAEAVHSIVAEATSGAGGRGRSLAQAIGRWSTHPLWGIPVLLLVLFLLYLVVGVVGAGTVVDFIESVVFGEYINPAATQFFSWFHVPFLQELMVGKYGLVTVALTYSMAIILPVVGFFFICFSLLEDVGYLPRLAVMANSVMKRIGLSGKAVLPLILGLGCDTMATLTTRTLESKRERTIATLLLALAIPCSAQMAVILAMLAGTSGAVTAIFVFIIVSQLLLVGFLASRVLPGKSSDFILEVPPVRMPQLSNVAIKTLSRMEWYFKEAVPLFILGTLILFTLDKVGLLAFLERAGAPVVQQWLGLPAAATAAFIFGFLRRDYGAAGFLMLKQQGLLSVSQLLVSLVTITLFIPCIANLFVIFKERGWKTALAIVLFIFPFAITIGGVLNLILKATGVWS